MLRRWPSMRISSRYSDASHLADAYKKGRYKTRVHSADPNEAVARWPMISSDLLRLRGNSLQVIIDDSELPWS
jgi:hypothetical protein